MAYEKPLPTITDEDRPFWEATKAHRLKLARCADCGHVRYPLYASCPKCLSLDREWTDVSGKGTVWGYVLMRQPYLPGYCDELPYNVVLVELDEGPLMYSNVVGIPDEEVRPGMRVEAVFDDVTDEFTLVRFRPVREPARA